MTGQEYRLRAHRLSYLCGINQRYHQLLESRLGAADKALRIVVGALAAVGLALSVPGMDTPPAGFVVALVSLAAALALNVVPVGDREKKHGELFRLWSDLRKDAELEYARACELGEDESVSKLAAERLNDLDGKGHALDADEPAPWRRLLIRCQEDENESRYGKGARTPEQVEEAQVRLAAPCGPTSSAAAAEAPGEAGQG